MCLAQLLGIGLFHEQVLLLRGVCALGVIIVLLLNPLLRLVLLLLLALRHVFVQFDYSNHSDQPKRLDHFGDLLGSLAVRDDAAGKGVGSLTCRIRSKGLVERVGKPVNIRNKRQSCNNVQPEEK